METFAKVISFKSLCRGKLESGEIAFSRENGRSCPFFGTYYSRPKPVTCRCTEHFQENIYCGNQFNEVAKCRYKSWVNFRWFTFDFFYYVNRFPRKKLFCKLTAEKEHFSVELFWEDSKLHRGKPVCNIFNIKLGVL